MSIRKKTKLEEISAASMSDLAFLLLIFFMVASVFYVKEGLTSTLPKKNAQPKLVLRKNVYKLEIDNQNISFSNVQIGKKSFKDLNDFKRAFNEEIEIPEIQNKYIVITAKNINIQTIVSVLSIIKEKGFVNLSLQRSQK
ncbi:MAG: ExbD/TolR family protein [Leptonema sp. (in: bacteria)]